jgi:hypothetical protein
VELRKKKPEGTPKTSSGRVFSSNPVMKQANGFSENNILENVMFNDTSTSMDIDRRTDRRGE